MALAAVVEEQATVDPLEREPARSVRVQAGRADVEHHVHRGGRVKVEVEHPLLLDQLHERLAVDGRSIHLLEGAVVLLLEHTVVAEPLAVGVAVLFELGLRAHGWQPVAAHDLVQVVDRADDDLEVLAAVEALHQLPQRVASFPSGSRSHHQLLLLRLVREDRHQSWQWILSGEQGELGEGVILERRADAVLVTPVLEVALQLETAVVREHAGHRGASPGSHLLRDVVLQHADVLVGRRIEVGLVPEDVADHGVVQRHVGAGRLRHTETALDHLHTHRAVLPRLSREHRNADAMFPPHLMKFRLIRPWPVK